MNLDYKLSIFQKKNKNFNIAVMYNTEIIAVTVNFHTFLILQKLIYGYLRENKYKTKNLKFKLEKTHYTLKESTYLKFKTLIEFLKTIPKEDEIKTYCQNNFNA